MCKEHILIYKGNKLNVLVIDEMKNEFFPSKETLLDKQMTRLIKEIGDIGKICNIQKFRKPGISKCNKIWEFKPDNQTRYFAIHDKGEIIIFNKVIKKKRSLKQKEYEAICQKAKKLGLE